jgi:outer membrane receptor protein involved in Fe transport
VTYYLADNLDITGGARYSAANQFYWVSPGISIFQPIPGRSLTPDSSSSATYLATLRWRPTDHINTYARAASGYRPGGPGISQDPTASKSFEPDTVWNYEVGVKATSTDNAYSVDFAVYHINWKNVQIDRYDSFGIPFTANGGNAKVDGVELEVAAHPIRGLTLRLNGAYTNARITQADPASTVATGAQAGDSLPLTPKGSLAGLADYSFHITPVYTGSFGATIAYQGNRHSSFPCASNDIDVEIPPYTTVDLRTGLSFGRISVQVRGENIFNAHGISTISSFRESPTNTIYPSFATYIRPTTISLSVGTTF